MTFVILDGISVEVHSDEWIKRMKIRFTKKIWNNGHPIVYEDSDDGYDGE